MSYKSVIGFGKYEDLTVQDMINLRRNRELRWIYYNCSMLSFIPEILELIGITDDFKISKPGKDREVGDAVNRLAEMRINKGLQKFNKDRSRYEFKKYINRQKVSEIKRFSKQNLQWKNQGH